MYKVFYNQKPIYLTTSWVENSEQTPLFFIKFTTAAMIVKALRSKRVKAVYLYHSKQGKLERHFLKRFPRVVAAGGLVEHQNGSILFIYRNEKWDLPKGKIEKNEEVLEGAFREVSEETGVTDLTVIKSLPETFHIYKANGRFKLKKTVWFLMRTTSENPLVPQIEENIQKAVWVERQNIPSLMENAYENIKILVNAFDS